MHYVNKPALPISNIYPSSFTKMKGSEITDQTLDVVKAVHYCIITFYTIPNNPWKQKLANMKEKG